VAFIVGILLRRVDGGVMQRTPTRRLQWCPGHKSTGARVFCNVAALRFQAACAPVAVQHGGCIAGSTS
jgi:hypothetical protein